MAGKLRKHFAVQEEWSFVDTEEQVVRSMDLLAKKYPFMPTEQQRVRPLLNLIIECKRSDLPYVFFLSKQQIKTPRFPVVAGLAHDEIKISTDDSGDTWHYDVLSVLEIEEHAFLRSDVPFCTTFTRCERKSDRLELSGSVPYSTLVYPLVKALEHFCSIENPPTTALYYDLHFVFGLAVLDAPMVGVLAGESAEPLMLPWVRIPRHRGLESASSYDHRRNIYALDVVHIAFLDTYIETHLLPFALELANRALKHHVEIADGQGFVSGMGKNSNDIEPRIVPTQASQLRDNFLRMINKGDDTLVMIPGLDSGALAEVESLLQAAGIEYAHPPGDLLGLPPGNLVGIRPGLFVRSSELSDVKKVLADFRIRTLKGDLIPIPW